MIKEVESWETTREKMTTLGVDLPDQKTLQHKAADPTLYVVSELGSQDGDGYGVTASYITPGIETHAAPVHREFDIQFPPEVILLSKSVQTLGGRAVLVGGAIRDLMYNELNETTVSSKDFDIEVYGLDQVTLDRLLKKIFPAITIKKMGAAFGVTKVYTNGMYEEPLDVSIPRTDTSTGPGHKDFESSVFLKC